MRIILGFTEAVRIVQLLPEDPWWTIGALALVGTFTAGALAVFRPNRLRWSILGSVVVLSVGVLPLVAGVTSDMGRVSAWGTAVTAVALAAIWFARRFHYRNEEIDDEEDFEPWMSGGSIE